MAECPLCLENFVTDGVCLVCGRIPEITKPKPVEPKAVELEVIENPLTEMLKRELLDIAKDIESITGESHMTKAQLIEAIEAAK